MDIKVKTAGQSHYEIRMGAVSIGFPARVKSKFWTKKALFDLYIKKHDQINNGTW
jgi:hypothetical protein